MLVIHQRNMRPVSLLNSAQPEILYATTFAPSKHNLVCFPPKSKHPRVSGKNKILLDILKSYKYENTITDKHLNEQEC